MSMILQCVLVSASKRDVNVVNANHIPAHSSEHSSNANIDFANNFRFLLMIAQLALAIVPELRMSAQTVIFQYTGYIVCVLYSRDYTLFRGLYSDDMKQQQIVS